MSYELAMEKAGATVHVFESFGSYQGDWWAKVTYNGKTGWINGSYGSCSGCDAFQAEFGGGGHYVGEDYESEYHSEYTDGFPFADCQKCADDIQKLADFGRSYLDYMLTQAEAEKRASENIEWDMDAEPMLKFVQENA